MSKIDVDLIMKQIKEEAKKKKYPQEIISFAEVQLSGKKAEDEFDYATFMKDVTEINENHNIATKVIISGNPLKTAVRKIYHSILVRLLMPVMYKQIVFNCAVSRAMNQIIKFDLDKVRRTIGNIVEDQQDMSVEIVRLHQRIDDLEKKIAQYEVRLRDAERKE